MIQESSNFIDICPNIVRQKMTWKRILTSILFVVVLVPTRARANFNGIVSRNGTTNVGVFSQTGKKHSLIFYRSDTNPTRSGDVLVADSDALNELGDVVSLYIEKELAVGAEIQVIHKGKTVFHKSYGYSDREKKRNWENNTICNIRSMTKPITSAAAQILIDRKLLDLDAPVAKYLDGFKNDKSKMITVRQVLTHRSGLPMTNLTFAKQYKSLSLQVAKGGEKGPAHEPGSKFLYSDLGTDVVGALVEEVSGELLNEFVHREIFVPLNMTNTFYGIDETDKRLQKAASLYLKNKNGWRKFWTPKTTLYPCARGSQTAYSTTTDYAKFLKMIKNGGTVGDQRILSTQAVGRMLEPVSRVKVMRTDSYRPTGFSKVEAHYGQMMMTHRVIGQKEGPPVIFGHSGSDGTNSWVWPEKDLMILYFTQSRGGVTKFRIEEPIDNLIIDNS
jgi:CubicO group peptidase (beta-lactamase class C family)